MRTTTDSTPANRSRRALAHPLMWLVLGIPAATVVAGIFTIWLAVTRADPPIQERVDKRGLLVNPPSATPPSGGGAATR